MARYSIFGHFLGIFYHFYLLKGNPLIQPLLLLTKLLSLRAVATISTEREQLQAITTPTICLKIEFLVIFGHFSPFVPAHGRPHDPISAFINKNVITYPHNMTPAITTPFQN